METSTNFGFNLPSRDNDDIADINQISDNFRIIDEIMKETEQTFSDVSENPQSGTAIAGVLSGYVSAEVGKGLSSNDYTNEEKEKLAGIEAGAQVNATVDTTYIPTSRNAQSGIAVAQAVDTCSPAIVITSDTGKAISIPDSAEGNIKGLTAYGESTQNGTPTPDSPVEIVSVENPVINVYGKNLCPTPNADFSFSQVTYYDLYLENLKVIDIQGVTLTLSVKQGYDDLQIGFGAGGETTDGTGYWFQYPAKGARTFTFIIPENYFTAPQTVTPCVRFYRSAGVSVQEYSISEIQLEIGSVATPYQPYIELQTITIPYTFRGLKNPYNSSWVARDELRVGNGKVEIVRNVGYLVCTSNLTWVKSSITATDFYYYANSELFGDSTNSTVFPKCTHFIAEWDTVVGHFYIASGRAYFNYAEYDTTTLEDWKTFLDTANMSIILASNKGTVEDITATEAGQALLALKSNYPNTSVVSDIDLNLTYRADTKNYIDNKIAALTALTLEG